MSPGGTGDPKEALRSFREWTRGRSNSEEAKAGKAKRGGTRDHRLVGDREGFQPNEERSVGEIKAKGADIPKLRRREGGEPGNASRTPPGTVKVAGARGEDQRPATKRAAGDNASCIRTAPPTTPKTRSTPREPPHPQGWESTYGVTL